MRESLVLVVEGRIAAKGSRTAGLRGNGSVFTRPASKHEAAWVEAVARAAQVARGRHGQLFPPYSVELDLFFAKPGRPKHGWPSRIDGDKACRAVFDGLVRGGLLEDDRHIVDFTVRKCWTVTPEAERCLIHIRGAA